MASVLEESPSPSPQKSNARKGPASAGQKGKSVLYRKSAAAFRWFHIYLSMLSFTALIFFAITGITLNHPTWFGNGQQTVRDLSGELPGDALSGGGELPEQLAIVEHLRGQHRLRGRVTQYVNDDQECMIVFKGPGYSADVFLDKASRKYTITEAASGIIAVMNDLHKGRDSGSQWALLIDVSAIVLVLMSVSGFGLLLYLKKRRNSGVLAAVVGTVALFVVWAIWVP